MLLCPLWAVCNLTINAVSSLLLSHATRYVSTGTFPRRQHCRSLFHPLEATLSAVEGSQRLSLGKLNPSTPHGVVASIWTLALGSASDFEMPKRREFCNWQREKISPRVVILVVHVFITFSHTTHVSYYLKLLTQSIIFLSLS